MVVPFPVGDVILNTEGHQNSCTTKPGILKDGGSERVQQWLRSPKYQILPDLQSGILTEHSRDSIILPKRKLKLIVSWCKMQMPQITVAIWHKNKVSDWNEYQTSPIYTSLVTLIKQLEHTLEVHDLSSLAPL